MTKPPPPTTPPWPEEPVRKVFNWLEFQAWVDSLPESEQEEMLGSLYTAGLSPASIRLLKSRR